MREDPGNNSLLLENQISAAKTNPNDTTPLQFRRETMSRANDFVFQSLEYSVQEHSKASQLSPNLKELRKMIREKENTDMDNQRN